MLASYRQRINRSRLHRSDMHKGVRNLNKLQRLWVSIPKPVRWIAGGAIVLALFVNVATPEEQASPTPPPEGAASQEPVQEPPAAVVTEPSSPPQQPAEPPQGQPAEPPQGEPAETTPEQPAQGDSAPAEPQALPGGVQVTRVVDGDTVEVLLNGVEEKVRMIGVDTPEVYGGAEPYGPEASAFTKSRLSGQMVNLEFDAEERDRYGRLLAYVWIGDEMFNETLVREGYAQVMTIPPNVRYADRFVALQREAREAGRGLWGEQAAGEEPGAAAGECPVKGNISSSGEKIYHVPGGAFYERTVPEECFDTPAAAEAAGYRASKR